jgi:hypothetical protein
MAIGPILLELWPAITQQQGQRVIQAFVSTQGRHTSSIPIGMTNAQFAELCIKRFIKNVVKGAERLTKEGELGPIVAQVEVEFPEE